NEVSIRRNRSLAGCAIGEVRWDRQLALAADFHADDALAPALDDAGADGELVRLLSIVTAVELGSIRLEAARVVDLHALTGLHLVAGADDQVVFLNPRQDA